MGRLRIIGSDYAHHLRIDLEDSDGHGSRQLPWNHTTSIFLEYHLDRSEFSELYLLVLYFKKFY